MEPGAVDEIPLLVVECSITEHEVDEGLSRGLRKLVCCAAQIVLVPIVPHP